MKITVLTSSRADWSSTGMVVKALHEADFEVSVLAIAASGEAMSHLMDAMTEDAVILRANVVRRSLNLTKDDPVNLAVAAGRATHLCGEALYALNPDLAVIPGDRWELASAASACVLAGIPIAHLGGGDRTAGSYDDRWRNVLSQLATIHLTTNQDAFERLQHNRIGKEASRWLFNVGSPAVDRIMQTELLPYERLTFFGEELKRPLIVVNWQPETGSDSPNKGLCEIIKALPADGTTIFIDQNDDAHAMEAAEIINDRAGDICMSFTPRVYLSLLKHCDVLVGNSSSGIFEAPALGTPVVNVGDRQLGRLQWASIKSVPAKCHGMDGIAEWIRRQIAIKQQDGGYFGEHGVLFGGGCACERIVQALRQYGEAVGLIREKEIA